MASLNHAMANCAYDVYAAIYEMGHGFGFQNDYAWTGAYAGRRLPDERGPEQDQPDRR